MEYCITVSLTYRKAFTVECDNDADAEQYADALIHALKARPEEMRDGWESWDYAVDDQDGRGVVSWSE